MAYKFFPHTADDLGGKHMIPVDGACFAAVKIGVPLKGKPHTEQRVRTKILPGGGDQFDTDVFFKINRRKAAIED